VTTQHTHSEHSDADINVVEHSPVSETETTLPPPQDVTVPSADEQQTQADTPVGASFEDRQRVSQEEEQDVSTFEPVEPHAASPLSAEEEVRPFTDFIEEFRQSEARFAASLQEYQSVPAISETSANDEAVVALDVTPAETPSSAEAWTTIPGVDKETEAAAVPPATRPVSPLLRPPTPRRVPRHTTGRHHEEHPIEKITLPPVQVETPETAKETSPVEPVVAEPVQETPRPARRYRFDRPSKVNASTPATPSSTPPVTPPVATTHVHADENKDVPIRPNNGHMFNGQTSEKEIVVPQPVKQATAVPQQVTEQITQKQPVAQEPSVVESTTPPVVPATQEDRRRRHGQDRQRSKEQPTAAPVTVPAPTPVVEAEPVVATPVVPGVPVVAQNDEVNPEDLPPLEYAELQKANSRRRRRRHSSSPVAPVAAASTPLAVTPKTVTPELPSVPVVPTPIPTLPVTVTPMATVPTPTSPVAMPRPSATPNVAVPPVTPYSITSGYTVGQMNQNHEGKNPFMGPEPSPARGTMAAQNVRSLRTDAQRTPVYPVRPTEATSASVHQLANIVSAAIQTQTDRMVSELRRANQSPTNISVSMPPFPSNERVGVFVDVANLLYSARTLRMAVDFGKLLDFLRGNRRLIRAQAYCPTSPQPGDEQMFLQAVKGLGYRITTKNYKTFSSGAKKADLDLDLCMDVVRLVDGKAVDCIVLVSGDSDFMPMLDYCSDHGVRVEVAAFDEAMSGTLRQSCDLFINLSMLEEIRA